MPDPNTHATHDVTLIAGHAAGDLVDSDRTRAQALLDTCATCAELRADLVAIASATHALPKLARAPRDFRLDLAQAARLRRGSWLRAALRPFGSEGFSVKPFAAAFTSVGVAGLLVVTVLPALLGSSGAAGPAPRLTTENQSVATAGPAATAAAGAGYPGQATNAPARADFGGTVAPSTYPGVVFGTSKDAASQGTGGPVAIAGGPETPEAAPNDTLLGFRESAPPNPILIGSLAMLGVGLALFGLRFASRRLH